MQAYILAGGKGTRLREITKDEIPKPMAVINDKPILEWTITNLKNNGIDDIYISVGHLHQKIIDYFGNGEKFGVSIHYIIEYEPLGSAGALFYAKDMLKDDFVICSGDVVFNIDIGRMLAFHKQKNSLITLLTHPNLHPYDSDLVITDKDCKITGFDFKGNERNYYYKNNVNAGFFILNAKALEYFKELKVVNMEKDFINYYIQNNANVYAYKSPEYIKDVGTAERFKNTELDMKNGIVDKKCLKNKQKAIFIDRDGVINEYKGFITSPDQIELIDGVIEAIKKINNSEYLAIIISNQPGVARGQCTFDELEQIFNKVETELGKNGVYLDAIYYCPHHNQPGFEGEVKELKIECDCRKPKPGMIFQAQKDYNIDLEKCVMIGDSYRDVLTGKNAGIKQILVQSGIKENEFEEPTYVAKNLLDGINWFFQKYDTK